jgi:hypothetical protein
VRGRSIVGAVDAAGAAGVEDPRGAADPSPAGAGGADLAVPEGGSVAGGAGAGAVPPAADGDGCVALAGWRGEKTGGSDPDACRVFAAGWGGGSVTEGEADSPPTPVEAPDSSDPGAVWRRIG